MPADPVLGTGMYLNTFLAGFDGHVILAAQGNKVVNVNVGDLR
jgi:flagellar basal body P-ring protein FlgI